MKKFSMLALAAAASLGVLPAAAQKAPAQAPLKVSAEFRKVAGEADTALKMKDYATAGTRITQSESLAKNDDEKFYAAELRLQLALAQSDTAGQIKAIETLVVSPRTGSERARTLGAHQQFLLGSAAMDKKDFAAAIPLLLRARELGSQQIDLPIMLANAYASTGKVAESVAEVDRAIAQGQAEGRKPPESWYRFAIPRVNSLGDRAATAGWMARLLTDYPTVANWRWGIVVYRDGKNRAGQELDKKQKIDLFRLMRTTQALADQQDYFDYAKATVESGLPWEAVAVIDEGRRSGKIPENQPDFAKAYASAQSAIKAEGSLDALAKGAAASKDGKEAAGTGDAFLASGDYARALELYDLALQKGGVDADAVNLHRGVALVGTGRKDDARAAFALVKSQPLSDIAQFWVAWLNLPAPLTA